MAWTSDVLPRCTSHKTSISLDYYCGNKHECNTHEAQEDRAGKTEDEDHEARDESGDTPSDTSTAVRIDIGLSHVLRETRILLRKRFFEFGQDSLFVL